MKWWLETGKRMSTENRSLNSFLRALPALSTSLSYTLSQGENQWTTRYARGFLNFTGASISIPKFFGMSALATRFCFYEYSTPLDHSLTPLRIDSQPDFVTDTAPKERWNLDFSEPQGEARLKQVVRDINLREMVAGLPGELRFFDTASIEDLSESLFLKVTLSPCVWFVRISSIQNIPFIFDQLWCIQPSRFVIIIVNHFRKIGHIKGVQRSWITFRTRKLHKIYNHGWILDYPTILLALLSVPTLFLSANLQSRQPRCLAIKSGSLPGQHWLHSKPPDDAHDRSQSISQYFREAVHVKCETFGVSLVLSLDCDIHFIT